MEVYTVVGLSGDDPEVTIVVYDTFEECYNFCKNHNWLFKDVFGALYFLKIIKEMI